MNEVLEVSGLKRSFVQADVAHRRAARRRPRRAPGEIVGLARPLGLGQVDPAAGGRPARRRLRRLDPDPRRGGRELERCRAHRGCAATCSASSTNSTICCPISARSRMSSCRSSSTARPRADAEARAEIAARHARPRRAAHPPPGQAFGRRAAARRGRPRARQPAGAGPRRRAHRQSRRGHGRHRLRRIPPPGPRAKAAPPWSPPITSGSPRRWTGCCGCTRAASSDQGARRRDGGALPRALAAVPAISCCFGYCHLWYIPPRA